ncbi:FAD-dependent monooxygenase [Kitasatospora sp. NPDC052896]|uniref:FAD-dependent monooxygenase n=1 Tax=Kitasatospora sp. NPDC052896 TaxID=3364061 RepID=UPI0037C515F6
MTAVLIVGAGPTGLTLACDLARRGVAVRVLERAARYPRGSRAKGPNQRSLEVLADLGVIEEVLASGAPPVPMRKYRDGVRIADADPLAAAGPTPDVPYARPWTLPQWRLEEILRDRLAGLGVRVELDSELVELSQDETGVRAGLADGRQIAAGYLVGCDGGHSTVRTLLGLRFAGRTSEDRVMVCGDVELTGLDRGYWHQWIDLDGGVMLCPIPGTRAGWWFQAGPERDAAGGPVPPSLDSFQRLLDRHARRPGLRLTGAALLSTYRVNVRMVDRYRVGRVLLAGDAAHVQPVAGGLGMNTGIQDAANLGWKLARVAGGPAGSVLLDSYQEERLPVAAWTLDLSSARLDAVLAAMRRPGGGLDTVSTPETSTLGVGYRWSRLARELDDRGGDRDGGLLRAGDRAPDAPCRDAATGAPVRLFEFFAGPHFTLLGFGDTTAGVLREAVAAHGASVRACLLDGSPHGLPDGVARWRDERGLARSAYAAREGTLVLVRPDGHLGLTASAPHHPGAVTDYLDRLDG